MNIAEFFNRVYTTSWNDSQDMISLFQLRQGISAADIERHENAWRLSIPNDYREFLTITNGCMYCGLDLCSIEGVAVYKEARLLGFHNWGNGDYDCLHIREGQVVVVFMNHGPGVTVEIASTFFEWLTRVLEEYRANGEVWHPGDYRYATHHKGVYAGVLEALAGVNCELNG